MKATKDHISFETAKLLKDCGVESKQTCHEAIWYRGTKDEERWMVFHDTEFVKNKAIERGETICPAYTWQEILWEYAEDFFGYETIHINGMDTGFGDYLEKPREILKLLQQKKYILADEYFREHCILINNK